MYHCPVNRTPLNKLTSIEGTVYPTIDGVPVLVSDPQRFLARHVHGMAGLPTESIDHLPIDAPDLISPFVHPRKYGAHGPFGTWLDQLGNSPTEVCTQWGHRYAPPGPVLDVGCGVGVATHQIARQGRQVWAFDRSPQSVLYAKDMLYGDLTSTPWPTWRGGMTLKSTNLETIPPDQVQFCVADAAMPPFAPHSFAWVHLGNIIDITDLGMAPIITAISELVGEDGIMTLSSPYDLDIATTPLSADPQAVLVDILDELGFDIVAESDHHPWVIRQYDRGFRVLLCHCMVLSRSTSR